MNKSSSLPIFFSFPYSWTWADGSDRRRWASDLTRLALSPKLLFSVTA